MTKFLIFTLVVWSLIAEKVYADDLPVIDFTNLDSLDGPVVLDSYQVSYVPLIHYVQENNSVQVVFDGSFEVLIKHSNVQINVQRSLLETTSSALNTATVVAPTVITPIVVTPTVSIMSPNLSITQIFLSDFAYGGNMAMSTEVDPAITRQFYLPTGLSSTGEPIITSNAEELSGMAMVGCDVVSTPEPSSLLLFSLSLLMFRRRRKEHA